MTLIFHRKSCLSISMNFNHQETSLDCSRTDECRTGGTAPDGINEVGMLQLTRDFFCDEKSSDFISCNEMVILRSLLYHNRWCIKVHLIVDNIVNFVLKRAIKLNFVKN